MADFIHIGSYIVRKSDISYITKHIDSINGSAIIVWLRNGNCLSIKFNNLSDLTHKFVDLLANLT